MKKLESRAENTAMPRPGPSWRRDRPAGMALWRGAIGEEIELARHFLLELMHVPPQYNIQRNEKASPVIKRRFIWAMRTALLGVCVLVVMASLAGPRSFLGSLVLTPSDKLTHLLAFYVIALLSALSFPPRRLWLSAAFAVTLGLCLEPLQGFTGREPSIADALFNMAGIAMALVPFAAGRLAQARAPGAGGKDQPERSEKT